MIKKKVFFPFLFSIFLILSGLFLISINTLYVNNNKSEHQDIILRQCAYAVGDPLSLDDINLSKTSIYQYFESINIKVNASHFTGGVNYTFIELIDLNQHRERYNMTHVGSNIFSINYSTGLNVSSQLLGLIKVTFSVYNLTGDLLNAGTTSKNFTIKPNIGVTIIPNLTFHKGDTFSATLTPDGFSMILYGWNTWNISIDDDLDKDEDLFSFLGYNQTEIAFEINNTFDEFKDYYIHVNLINSTNNEIINTSYHTFTLENTNPEVVVSSVSLNSSSIYRSNVDNCRIQLNVTDLETTNPSFLNVSMILELSIVDYISFGINDFENNGDGSFQCEFHVGYTESIGNYNIKLTITDPLGGETEYIYGTPLTVLNNAPEINAFMINGIPITQGFSIYYSESLTFTFDVSDVDGEITDITVVLISSNNQRIERKAGTNSEIYFSSYELVTGIWYVYIYIEDSDGAVVSLTDDYDFAPQAIRVIPDVLSAVLPWIALVTGLIIGTLIGVGITYYWKKTKTSDGQDIAGKKKPISQKSILPKKQKERESSEVKTSDSEAKKISDKQKEEKAKPERETTQRKIKRKL